MKSSQRHFLILGVIAGLILSGVIGWAVGKRSRVDTTVSTTTDGIGRKVLYWHDPMTPGVHFEKPGKSPFMDMDLEPVYADEAPQNDGPPIVTVRPEIMNSLGVRIALVTRGKSPRETEAHGYVIRGTDNIMVLADIAERDAGWVRSGFSATVSIAGQPGQSWPAVIEAVERDLDVGSRLTKARVRITRSSASLTPNTLADVTIRAPAASTQSLFVPREAVIRTGTRVAVIMALGEGRFQPVDVVVGPESGDFVEIVKGLKENDGVVVSGQFLIDSDASARASFKRMEPSSGSAEKAP